jgi:hypothetical protein
LRKKPIVLGLDSDPFSCFNSPDWEHCRSAGHETGCGGESQDTEEARLEEKKKEKWYNNRAKVIFSFQAFPPLGVYALLRSTAFTVPQKFMVVIGVSALIGLFIYSGIGQKMNQFVFGLFT